MAWYYLSAAGDESEAPDAEDAIGATQNKPKPSGDEIVGSHSREWIGLFSCPRIHTVTMERAVGNEPGDARKTE